jgi:hypothetical protein
MREYLFFDLEGKAIQFAKEDGGVVKGKECISHSKRISYGGSIRYLEYAGLRPRFGNDRVKTKVVVIHTTVAFHLSLLF